MHWVLTRVGGQTFVSVFVFVFEFVFVFVFVFVLVGEGKDEYLTVLGKTISTDDFYEGQVLLLIFVQNKGVLLALTTSHQP